MREDERKKTDMEEELEALYLKVASLDSHGNTQKEEKESKEPIKSQETLVTQQSSETTPARERKHGSFHSFRIVPTFGLFTLLLILIAIFLWPMIQQYNPINVVNMYNLMKFNNVKDEISHVHAKGKSELSKQINVTKSITVATNEQTNATQLVNPKESNNQTEDAFSLSRPDTLNKGKYTIQVKAYPESEKKDAIMFFASLKKDQFDVYVEKVRIPGKGDWYRILLGHFIGYEEASNYIKDKKLFHAYPGCFVQVKSEG